MQPRRVRLTLPLCLMLSLFVFLWALVGVSVPAPLSLLCRFSHRFSRVCPSLWAFVFFLVLFVYQHGCILFCFVSVCLPLSPFVLQVWWLFSPLLLFGSLLFLSWHLLSPYLSPALLVSLLLLASSLLGQRILLLWRNGMWYDGVAMSWNVPQVLSFEIWLQVLAPSFWQHCFMSSSDSRSNLPIIPAVQCWKVSQKIIPLGLYFLDVKNRV